MRINKSVDKQIERLNHTIFMTKVAIFNSRQPGTFQTTDD